MPPWSHRTADQYRRSHLHHPLPAEHAVGAHDPDGAGHAACEGGRRGTAAICGAGRHCEASEAAVGRSPGLRASADRTSPARSAGRLRRSGWADWTRRIHSLYASRNSRRHTSNVRASERKSFTTTGTPNSQRPVGQRQVRVADAGCGQAYAHLSGPGLGSPPAGAGLRNAKFAPPPRPSAQISWLRPAGSRLAGRTGYRACRW